MAKKNTVSAAASAASANALLDALDQQQPTTQPAAQPQQAAPAKPRKAGGASASLAPGMTRRSHVLPEQMVEDLRSIAGYFRMSEGAVVRRMLQQGIDALKSQYGEDITTSRSWD